MQDPIPTPREVEKWEETPEGSTEESTEFVGETEGFWKGMGFTCNPMFALVLVFSLMAFTRNTGTNLFPLILGLFLEIGGTSPALSIPEPTPSLPPLRPEATPPFGNSSAVLP
ncbi:hypothetical protein B0H14DRAFT_3485920 [Mycena olivaceomarginata]|nr:hypothetical protein B0H14DRAFT_3485920 [Mycena olivaceomarginata]